MLRALKGGQKEKKTNQQTLESQSPSKQLVWKASFNVSGVVAYIF
jgi:hypothetical protein